MNIVIFSKDRACQLDALYRSIRGHLRELATSRISIIWKASTPFFRDGYSLFHERYCSYNRFVNMIEEKDFKCDVQTAIDNRHALLMFLVDDVLFKDHFSLADREIGLLETNPQLLTTSLRLWKGVTSCYMTNTPSQVPEFVNGCMWNWKGAKGDWGYPFSLDGNIYRTEDIAASIEGVCFQNPNELEAALAARATHAPEYACCYVNQSKLVNIPANRVQTTFANRHASSTTPEDLNGLFLNGWTISPATVEGCAASTVHVELPYIWESAEHD